MNKQEFMVEVNNVSPNANKYPYIIANVSNGELWYYGVAKNHFDAMNKVSQLVNGLIIENKNIEM